MFLLVVAPAKAGDVTTIGEFESAGVTAEIDTYSEGSVVVAVIAFKANGRALTFAFDRHDWPALERLWQSAKQARGSKFVSAGSVTENGTDEKGVITAAGGPVIRLTIVSPIDGAIVFNVPRGKTGEFEAKLRQAAAMTTKS